MSWEYEVVVRESYSRTVIVEALSKSHAKERAADSRNWIDAGDQDIVEVSVTRAPAVRA